LSSEATLAHGPTAEGESFPATVTWGKLMMWLFLCSDAMSFGALIATYFAARQTAGGTWPNPQEHLGIGLTAVMTLVLIISSVTMVQALSGAQTGNQKKLTTFLFWTIGGGLFFLGCQAYEWTHLIKEGMSAWNSLFEATFFVLTGFHGCHVTGGVIYNSAILRRARKGCYGQGRSSEVEIAGLYWHFVDLVWILIFTFVYLI
jgi:cytochrome c oxidase subunit 3